MRWENYDAGQAIEGTEPLEDGRHTVRVVTAEETTDRDGRESLRVKFAPLEHADRWAWPVLRIGTDARGLRLAVQLADALGLDRSRGLSITPADCSGAVVVISTARWQSEHGAGVRVDAVSEAPARFRNPAASAAAERAADRAPRTPAAGVRKAAGADVGGGSDDFPF